MTISESNLAKKVLRAMLPGQILDLQHLYHDDYKYWTDGYVDAVINLESAHKLWKLGLMDRSYNSKEKMFLWEVTKLGENVVEIWEGM